MHFDLGWKSRGSQAGVRECGGARGQRLRLPACHILFIYNFQCATLTSVTFQLVGGGVREKKEKKLAAKKDIPPRLLFLLSKEVHSAKIYYECSKTSSDSNCSEGNAFLVFCAKSPPMSCLILSSVPCSSPNSPSHCISHSSSLLVELLNFICRCPGDCCRCFYRKLKPK